MQRKDIPTSKWIRIIDQLIEPHKIQNTIAVLQTFGLKLSDYNITNGK